MGLRASSNVNFLLNWKSGLDQEIKSKIQMYPQWLVSGYFKMFKSLNNGHKKLSGRPTFKTVSHFSCFCEWISRWEGDLAQKRGKRRSFPSFSVHSVDVAFPEAVAMFSLRLGILAPFSIMATIMNCPGKILPSPAVLSFQIKI